MRIALTGSTGFVGAALARYLATYKTVELVLPVRRLLTESAGCQVLVGEVNDSTDWSAAVAMVDVVIHCAARVHVMDNHHIDSIASFRAVNVEATLRLARAAAAAGVRRFVFLSSVKVHGEESMLGHPFSVGDTLAPADPYGFSKLEAEQGLLALAAETGMEVVVIRPPLIYGPGVKANFRSMMEWLTKGVPLPLGAVYNRRSLLALDNLVDLIVACLDHPAAANQVFLASDGEDLSTTELLRRLGAALGRPARLLPVPGVWLEAGARLFGRADMAKRLCGSLQVDIEKTRHLLGWTPPVSVDAALYETARHFLEHR